MNTYGNIISNRKIMEESRMNSIIYRLGAWLIVSSLFMTAVSANKQITLVDKSGSEGAAVSRWRRGTSKSDAFMVGHRTNCDNEGEVFPTTDDFQCFQCICRNGFVECEPEQCPSVDECYFLEKKRGCCKRCKGCVYNATSYRSGTEWNDPEDPCLTFKCLGGVVTQVNLQCYTPCAFPTRPKPDSGQCCPTCVGCKYNGQTVLEGREVTSSEDPCLKCQCKNRRLECTKKACPVIHCPLSKQKKAPGECCPKCIEHRDEMLSLPGRCMLGKNIYNNGDKFSTYDCSACSCHNGTLHCRRVTCPVLECPLELQIGPEPGSCCKKCPEVAELQSVCVYNQTTYQPDETWNMDNCRSCRCVNGRPNCAEMKCPELRCRANEVKNVPAGACCAKCVESAGICTVFGDPHYKTFDGKFFSFQGMCKYQLTADCVGHTFSIRATNDRRATKSSSWTKTITLKVHNLKVNLGQKMRVKVNGSRVDLPYLLYSPAPSLDLIPKSTTVGNSILPTTTNLDDYSIPGDAVPELEIRMTEEGVSVITRIGVQLLWDGTNFLQVQAPVTYKNRLCGLCGNYNGMSRDDFKTRRGVNLNETTVWQFANSWRVGGTKACSDKYNENYGRKPTCKYRKKGSMCHPLHGYDSIFESCTERVNPSNYNASCHKDMCECESDLCFCDSFTAYAHECQRLGVPLPAWRTQTGCTLQAMRNGALVVSKQKYFESIAGLRPISTMNSGGSNTNTISRHNHKRQKLRKRPIELLMLDEKIPAELMIAAENGRRGGGGGRQSIHSIDKIRQSHHRRLRGRVGHNYSNSTSSSISNSRNINRISPPKSGKRTPLPLKD